MKHVDSGKKLEKVIKPYSERIFKRGIQKLYRFSNGYGASVVRALMPTLEGEVLPETGRNRYSTYTCNESEWEMAVLKWDKDDYEIDYDNSVTDGDVLGHLTSEEVERKLLAINSFPSKKE